MGALIRHATAKEEVLGKISQLKQEILTARRIKEIEELRQSEEIKVKNLKRKMRNLFLDLVFKYFSVDETRIMTLSDREVEQLFSLVCERASKTYHRLVLLWLIPPFGWVILAASEAVEFIRSTPKLKKMLGSDFDPVKILREY